MGLQWVWSRRVERVRRSARSNVLGLVARIVIIISAVVCGNGGEYCQCGPRLYQFGEFCGDELGPFCLTVDSNGSLTNLVETVMCFDIAAIFSTQP